ncbi:MAG: LamG-like jellyroll fold domain-containing protein [Candidatus Nanoarchaeia archaeon]
MANEKLNPTNEKIEAIAIAPYFGASIADDLVDKNEVDSITVNQILDRAELDIQTNVNNWMTTMSHYATTHTVQLLAYEGGQHLRATNAGLNNDVLTQKLIAANMDPRMKELYTLYLTQWKQVGGGLFVHFSSIVKPTKWGSWGLLEYTGQPASEAPKYQAVKEFVPTSLPPVIPPVEEPPVTPPSDLPPPTSTLLAYWNFDNNVQDQSGNNYHLQNHNVNCNVPGKINQGCLIGNNAESLDITPYPLAQNAQAFSFATFVNFQGNEGEKHIMSLGFESFGLKYFGHGEFHCILRNSNGDFLYNHDDNFWPVIGQWHHVACTYNPTDKTLRFYVDGQLNEAFVVPTFDSFKDLPQSGMGVGCKKPGFCEGPVPGFPIVTVTMDEAKLYTTTLTDQQVLKLSRGESF